MLLQHKEDIMKNILIVDDSTVSRRILKNMFEAVGHTVVGEALNGKEGYDLYVKLSPDVVTMDITMPEMNGLDALKHIKEHDPDAKVIILSAAGQQEKKEEAQKLGATEFITKPYEKRTILEAVERC